LPRWGKSVSAFATSIVAALRLGVFALNHFVWFVWFAVHLIRPAATFSPSDAEKGGLRLRVFALNSTPHPIRTLAQYHNRSSKTACDGHALVK